MMFDTMFSRNPFAYFDNEFEDFSPWTSWGYNRTPPRQQHRGRSAYHRRRRPTWTTPFWEIPSRNEEEMPLEDPVEENYYTTQRKGGDESRHKRHGSPKGTNTRVITTPRHNDSAEESNRSNDVGIKQDVQTETEDLDSGFPIDEREREKENITEEKEKQLETTASAMEGIDKMEEQNTSEDKLEECETVEQGSDGEKINETEEKINKEFKEKMIEEQPSEDENQDDKMENPEENYTKEKLKLIDEQLKRARELAPKEVIMSPMTDKQKLYLTEMLLRCILDLDSIETRGIEAVKQRRREVVREIQSYLDIVENETNIAPES